MRVDARRDTGAVPGPRALRVLRATAVFAALFGVTSIAAGLRVLVGGADAGAIVPFVLWFNFLAGFAYVATAYGLWHARRWSACAALALAIGTGLVFMAFGIHVVAGAAFEARTVIAMSLRTGAWGVIAAISSWLIVRRNEHRP